MEPRRINERRWGVRPILSAGSALGYRNLPGKDMLTVGFRLRNAGGQGDRPLGIRDRLGLPLFIFARGA